MRVVYLSLIFQMLWILPAWSSAEADEASVTDELGYVAMEGFIEGRQPVRAYLWFEPNHEGGIWILGSLHETSPRKCTRIHGSKSKESDELSLYLSSNTHGGETIGCLEAKWNKSTETDLASLTGNLRMLKGGSSPVIQLREIKPPGSVELDYHRFEESYERSRGINTLHRQLGIAFPQITTTDPNHRAINETIRHWARYLLEDSSVTPDLTKTSPKLTEIEGVLRAELPDRSEPEQMVINRQEDIRISHVMEVLYNQNGLLCLRITTTKDLGGAHEMFYSQHLTFDLLTGSVLKANDLLNKGWKAAIAPIAADNLREQFELEAGAKLSAAGLKDEDFKLNDNFFINNEGLGFYFDPYEIAPFSLGAITPMISLHKISSLIRQGSALWRIQECQIE